MFEFIISDVLMVSLGTMFYIVVRALPRFQDDAESKKSIFERFFASGIPEKLDVIVRAFSIKTLRKAKVYLLKIENAVTAKLRKMTGGSKSAFGAKSEEVDEQKKEFADLIAGIESTEEF